ncbi:9226_t:CDS:1, partial [Dentiscutata heterogama]
MSTVSKFECNICGNLYNTNRGLKRHLNIVMKYNTPRSDLDILPETTIQQFKGILVHYIHKRLQKGYKQLGKQTVLVPATESQFYAIFKNYIHYYSATKNKYKCIFHGSSSNQELANILDSQNWGIKFYDQQQFTYIVLCDDNVIENEDNPIKQAITQQLTLNKKVYKPKYKYGQIIVEWKKQKNIDSNGYITQA